MEEFGIKCGYGTRAHLRGQIGLVYNQRIIETSSIDPLMKFAMGNGTAMDMPRVPWELLHMHSSLLSQARKYSIISLSWGGGGQNLATE